MIPRVTLMAAAALWALSLLGAQNLTAPHGAQEYLGAGTYTWTAPSGVTALTVEFWGAGGGGTQRASSQRSGNGGGSGAYVRTVVPVVPGQTYYIQVGAGGAGDTGGGAGSPGQATQITDSSSAVLTYAGGGGGGSKITNTGGPGGIPASAAGVKRTGRPGGVSTGVGGNLGGAAIQGSIEDPYFMDGGAGASYRSTAAGGAGGTGYAIISW
jgi:hypothetical protein